MTELTWTDPPASVSPGRPSAIFTPAVLAELRANPGRWALVTNDAWSTVASRARKSHPDLEVTFRYAPGSRAKGTVYARAREVTP